MERSRGDSWIQPILHIAACQAELDIDCIEEGFKVALRPTACTLIIEGLLLHKVSKSLEFKPFSPCVIIDYCINEVKSRVWYRNLGDC